MFYKTKRTLDFNKDDVIFNASIKNDEEFMKLRFDQETLKIYETEESTIAFTQPVQIVLGGTPSTKIHIQVENDTGYYVSNLPKIIPSQDF